MNKYKFTIFDLDLSRNVWNRGINYRLKHRQIEIMRVICIIYQIMRVMCIIYQMPAGDEVTNLA